MSSRWLRAHSVVVFVGLFSVTQTHAVDWGRIAAGAAGSYTGAYLADRAGGGTGAQIGAAIIGNHLATRAYDSYQSKKQSRYYEESEQDVYEYSYSSSQAPLSYRPSTEDIQREYAEFREANTEIFNKAKSSLVDKIQELQSTSKARWICASVCAGFDGYRLKAQPLISSHDQAQAAYDQINKACPANRIFSNGISDSHSGTQKISLNETQLICFPNNLSVEQAAQVSATQTMKVRYTNTNVKIKLQNGKEASQKFVFELMNQLNDPTMTMMSSGQASPADIAKKVESGSLKEQLAQLNENLEPAKMQPDGSVVMESKQGVPASQRIRIVMKQLSRLSVQSVMEFPMTIEHKCGLETAHVTVTSVTEMMQFGSQTPKKSKELVELYMKASGYSEAAADSYCK